MGVNEVLDVQIEEVLNSKDYEIIIIIDRHGKVKFVNDKWLDCAKSNHSKITNWIDYDFMNIFYRSEPDSEIEDFRRKLIGVLSGKITQSSFRYNEFNYSLKANSINFKEQLCLQLEFFKGQAC